MTPSVPLPHTVMAVEQSKPMGLQSFTTVEPGGERQLLAHATGAESAAQW